MALAELNFDKEPVPSGICADLITKLDWDLSEYSEQVWCGKPWGKYERMTLENYFLWQYNKEGYQIIPSLTVEEVRKELKKRLGITWEIGIFGLGPVLNIVSVKLKSFSFGEGLDLNLFFNGKKAARWKDQYNANLEIIRDLIGILVYEKNK